MASITIYPNADSSIGISGPSGAHYGLVNGSSYIYTSSTSWLYDVYRLAFFGLGSINSITITSRYHADSYNGGSGVAGFRILGNNYWGTTRTISTSWETYTDTWSTCPATGAAWTIDDLAHTELILGLKSAGYPVQCSTVSITIDYTPYGASSEMLYPNGVGSYTNISSQEPGSGSHYDKVDEAAPSDDDGTYVAMMGSSYLVDTYALSNLSSSDILRINAVVVFWRVNDNGNSPGSAKSKVVFYTNGGLVYGTERSLSVDNVTHPWASFAEVFLTNPATGAAWTKAEILALEAGAAIHGVGTYSTMKLTQVNVLVCYTVDQAPATPSTPSGITSGASATSYSFSTSTTDPESDTVTYTFDWGDGNQETTSSHASGESVSVSHSWATPGTYNVKVKATDSFGAASGWSSTSTIVISSPGSYARVVGLW